MTPKDVARHELGGRHVLQGGLGEDLPGHLGLSELVEEAVLPRGVDLEGVAQALLLLGEPGAQGELLVEELAGQDRVGLLHRVRRGQVVVLARVDDDAREGVDPAGEALVDQRPLHVDVTEENAVEGVIEHHVQPLQGAHGGDLRHAEAGAVVAEADVAMLLRADLVESRPHEAEVLLGGVGAAEALGGGPVGHVIEEALARGADDRDHVRPLSGGGLGLDDVLVDVARGHDDVEVGPLLVAVLGQVLVPPGHILADALRAGFGCRLDGGLDLVEAVRGHL